MTPTGEQLAEYFGKISHSNADIKRIIGVFLISAIWILVVIYLTKGENIKEYLKKKFSSLKAESNLSKKKTSSGYVYDINNNQIFTMDMNPTNESSEVFVPKYKEGDKSQNASVKTADKKDLLTEVNTIVNLLVKGDKMAVFDYVKKIGERGVSVEALAEEVVLELDSVLQAKISGETNRKNIVLAQIVSSWSKEKIESVIGGFFSIIETGYADKVMGVKVALMRVMKN